MHLLPAIDCRGHQWRLPLSDYTAASLANALFAKSPGRMRTLLEETIAEDPALALWLVSFTWTQNRGELTTLSQAAASLTRQRWNHLAAHCRPFTDEGDGCVERWRQALKASLNSATSSDQGLAPRVPNASQWLHACDLDGSDAALREGLLPTFWWEGAVGSADAKEHGVDGEAERRAEARIERWSLSLPFAGELLASAIRKAAGSPSDEPSTSDEERLREKLASLKEFAYGASHELNNPLFNISSRAQVLLREEKDPQRRQKLATIYSHAMRASEMISDIALAARPAAPKFASVDAVAVAREVIDELLPLAREQASALVFEAPNETLEMDADVTQLAVLIREICVNGLESFLRADRAGNVAVRLKATEADSVEVIIEDDGPGLDERARRHLFDPFFSGYESGRGFGFGLTKCWQIAQAHGGTISAASEPGRGTSITVRLPRRQAATPSR